MFLHSYTVHVKNLREFIMSIIFSKKAAVLTILGAVAFSAAQVSGASAKELKLATFMPPPIS